MVIRPQKYPGGCGKAERGRNRQLGSIGHQTGRLLRVGRVCPLIRTGQMAHDQLHVQSVQHGGAGSNIRHILRGQAKAGHARIQLQHNPHAPLLRLRHRTDPANLLHTVQHRAQSMRQTGLHRIGPGAVQHGNAHLLPTCGRRASPSSTWATKNCVAPACTSAGATCAAPSP